MARHDETADHIDLLDRLDALATPRLRRLTLVYCGQDAPVDPARAVWTLDAEVVIGRDPGPGGIELDDRGASRRHARVGFDAAGEHVVLEDLGSRNGTYVDGRRDSGVALEHGSVIRIADSILVYSDVELTGGLPSPSSDAAVGPSRAVAELRAELSARTPLSVLILGPTGAGKELMARRIHELSGRPGDLVAVNCGTLSRELVASELFGHTGGAFTGAATAREGLFVAADRGTIFLDEIADLPLDQQPALLRTLQEGTVRPVGADRERTVDVRVVAATHKRLPDLVEQDRFRQDLYARLCGVTIELPGLSARREEILPLLSTISGRPAHHVSPDAAEALVLHDWPQNVREIQHLAAQLDVLGPYGLELNQLPPPFKAQLTTRRRAPAEAAPTKLDRAQLVALLETHQGNVAMVAKALGKHRAQVYRWLRKEGLQPERFRSPDGE